MLPILTITVATNSPPWQLTEGIWQKMRGIMVKLLIVYISWRTRVKKSAPQQKPQGVRHNQKQKSRVSRVFRNSYTSVKILCTLKYPDQCASGNMNRKNI